MSLAGITRHELVAAVRADGIRLEEGRYPPADLTAADEAFLTGTVRGVTPVVRIDGRPIGDGKPGPVTRKVSDLYLRAVSVPTV